MQRLQAYLSLIVGGAVYLLAVFLLWSGTFAAQDLENTDLDSKILAENNRLKRAVDDRAKAKGLYDETKGKWFTRRRLDAKTDFAAAAADAHRRVDRLQDQITAAKGDLRAPKPEGQLRLDLTRDLSRLADRLKIAEYDRRFTNLTVAAAPGSVGLREIGVDFQFRTDRAGMVALLDRNLDTVGPCIAVEAVTIAPLGDESDPEKKRLEIKGRLSGYFFPAE